MADARKEAVPASVFSGNKEVSSLALYIHIPFCYQKCPYCDFLSYPLGEAWDRVNVFVDDLKREIRLRAETMSPDYQQVSSVYLGGGTPTCLPAEYLEDVLDTVRNFFPVALGVEITVEANPGTVDACLCQRLLRAGVNRLSLGAQAFQDDLLKLMGRIHNKADIRSAFNAARRAGLENINLDLIYGLPSQTIGLWRDSLKRAVSLGPEHVSTYGLHLEPFTPWGQAMEKGGLDLPDEELVADMYDLARDLLPDSLYEQYEIANFALPGKRSRHNQVYWRNGDYLGLGVGATSHLKGRRFLNVSCLDDYHQMLVKGFFPVACEEPSVRLREMDETVFLGLRMLEGLHVENFKRRFGVDPEEAYGSTIAKFIGWGYMEKTGSHLRLTGKALPVANLIFREFVRSDET